MKASGVFNQLDWHGEPPVTDYDIETDCEQCGKVISLGKCRSEQHGNVREYRCPSCPELVLRVASEGPPSKANPGRVWKNGSRIGKAAIFHPRDLRVRSITIPGSPDSLIDHGLQKG